MALQNSNNDTTLKYDKIEPFFLYFYSFEMAIKIIGMGLILSSNSYLKDCWNILDFSIVVSSWIPIIIGNNSQKNLSFLRSLRVLRPLKTISSIKDLKVLLITLISALPMLIDTLVINLFFFLVFAIAGLQLFSGLFKKQ